MIKGRRALLIAGIYLCLAGCEKSHERSAARGWGQGNADAGGRIGDNGILDLDRNTWFVTWLVPAAGMMYSYTDGTRPGDKLGARFLWLPAGKIVVTLGDGNDYAPRAERVLLTKTPTGYEATISVRPPGGLRLKAPPRIRWYMPGLVHYYEHLEGHVQP